MRAQTWTVAVAGLVACGSSGSGADPGVDLSGVYQVSSEVSADVEQGAASCSDTSPVTDEVPAYIRLARFDGSDGGPVAGSYFRYSDCTDAAGSNCMYDDELVIGVDGFLASTDGGWETVVGGTSTNAGACSLSYGIVSATLQGTTLTIEGNRFGEPVGSGSCTTEEAEMLGSSMPCLDHSVTIATHIGP